MVKNNKNKLNADVIPINYYLKFEPIPDFKFKCFEKIKINIKKPLNTITLNAVDLKIYYIKIINNNKKNDLKIIYDKKYETIQVILNKKISGNAEIVINFEGINNNKMYGFYRSEYTINNKKDHILTSQFEPTDARSAFVCFDQPNLKATFDVSFVIKKDLTALSNMPVKNEQIINNKKLVEFETTRKMSTYLLYIGVGKFDFVETKFRNIKIRVITVQGKRELAHLALNYVKQILPFYENYFKIKYMLPKLDLIAIPDFSAGAMENWGAITFREKDLLGNKSSSISAKQRIATVIAHEMAHQWFGDLVTMKWWDDLWLNESFANFMESKCVNEIFPKWKIYKEDVFTYNNAFNMDSFKSTHPVHININAPNEINSIFDEVTYDKGGSVLNMIEDFIGKENFRNGLNLYLTKFQYNNAVEEDLWNNINIVFNRNNKAKHEIDIKKIARKWINSEGYPIISVIKEGNKVKLEQKRFFLLNYKIKKNSIWPIPITYLSENQSNKILFDKKSQIINLNKKWIKLNLNQKGFYRVKYDPNNLKFLGLLIKNNLISAIDAYGIENDLFILARTGRIKLKLYLDFINTYCSNLEDKYPLNISVLSHLEFIYSFSYKYQKSNSFKTIKSIFYSANKNLFDKVKFNEPVNDDPANIKLRSILIKNLGILGDKQIISKANELFKKIEKGIEINENIKSAILNIAAFYGTKQTFNKIQKLYLKSLNPEHKLKFLMSLAKFNNLNLLKNALNFTLSKNVKLQDKIFIPIYITTNYLTKDIEDLLINWLLFNWKKLMNLFPATTKMLDNLLFIFSFIDNEKDYKRIKLFFDKKENMREDILRAKQQVLEKIKVNITFKKAIGLK
ncbi:MAG: M1 family metallopeptidase [Candidatus Marsarchaeota archaeon]|nr:M1 family metallopeptidase [Candidatus Marsarchaeota archaeon]